MTTIEVQLPRLLQGTTRDGTLSHPNGLNQNVTLTDFSTKAVLRPIKQGVKLSYDTLSKATLTMSESDDVLKMHDFVELYSDRGSLGIFRVVGSGLNPLKNRTYNLNHAFDTFNDCVIGNINNGTTTDGTVELSGSVYDVLFTVLTFQQNSVERCYWKLGTIESSVASQLYKFNNTFNNAKSVLDAIADKYPDCVYTYDFSTTPWTLNFVKRETATRTELRLNRNISGIDINRSDTDQCTRLFMSLDNYTDPLIAEENKTVTYIRYENPEAQAKWGIIAKAIGVKTEEISSLGEWLNTFWKLHADPQLDISITAQDYSKYSGEPMDAFWLGSMCRVILADYDGDDREYDERIMQMDNDDVLNKPLAWKLALSNKRKTAGGSIAKAREKTESAANTARSASIRRSGGGGGSSSGDAITNVRITGPENNVYTLQYYKNGAWNNAETTFSRATNLIGGYHIGGGGLVDVYNWIDPDSHPGYLKVMADPQGNTKTFVISPAGSPVAHWGDGHSVDPATGQTESRTTYYSKINVIDGDSYSVIGTVRNFQVDASSIINLGDIEWMAFNSTNGLPSHRVGTWAVYASQSDAENGSNALRSKSKEFFLTQGLDGDKPVVFLRPGSASANPVAKLEVEGVVGSGAVDGIQVGAPNVGSYSNGTIPIEFSVSAYEILDGVDEDEDGNDDMNVIYSMNPSPVFTLPISHSLTLDENTSTATVTGDLTTTLSRSSFTTDQTIGYVSTALSYQSASTFRVTSALTSGQNGSGTKYGVATTDIELRASSVPGNTAAMRFGAYVGNTAWAPQTITLTNTVSSGQSVVQAMVNGTPYAEIPVTGGSGGSGLITYWESDVSDAGYADGRIILSHTVTANRDDDEGGYVPVGTDGTSNPYAFPISFPWFTRISAESLTQTRQGSSFGWLEVAAKGGPTFRSEYELGTASIFLQHDIANVSQGDGTYKLRVKTSLGGDSEQYMFTDYNPSHTLVPAQNTSTNVVTATRTFSIHGHQLISDTPTIGYVTASYSSGYSVNTVRITSALRASDSASATAYGIKTTTVTLNGSYTAAATLSQDTPSSTGTITLGAYIDNDRYASISPSVTVGGGYDITTANGFSDVTFSVGGTVVARRRVRSSIPETIPDTISGSWSNGTYTVVSTNGERASTTLWGASAGTPSYNSGGVINVPYTIYDLDPSTGDANAAIKSGTMYGVDVARLLYNPNTIEPTTSDQTITPPAGYIGLAGVTVKGTTAASQPVYSGQRQTESGTWIAVGNNGDGDLIVSGTLARAEVRFLANSKVVYQFGLSGTFAEPTHVYSGQRMTASGNWIAVGNNGTGSINFSGNEAYTSVRFIVDGVERYRFHLEGTVPSGGDITYTNAVPSTDVPYGYTKIGTITASSSATKYAAFTVSNGTDKKYFYIQINHP